MKTYDLHQDLMTHLRFADVLGQSHQTSFADIAASDIDLVIATAFPFPPGDDQYHESVPTLITEELGMYRDFLAQHDNWQLVRTASDLDSFKQKIILHLEGLNVFDGSPVAWAQLRSWVQSGVRSIGTHWNVENSLGGGTLQPESPLTDLGREMISFLEQHNMLFDLAHMGRQSFADAVQLTNRPLYVSHGNADAVCPNVRNYTDGQLRQIAETDGVIGVFFAGRFVGGKEEANQIEDVIAHITHMRDLIGVRHIAIGTDLGGIVSQSVTDLNCVNDVPNLYSALRAANYSESDIELIAWKNADRVLRAHLGGAK